MFGFAKTRPVKMSFNDASTLSEAPGTAKQAFFGGIRAGNLPLVEDVLKTHPEAIAWQEIRDDLNIFDTFGLHVAVREGKEDIVKALTAAGATANVDDHVGKSPLTDSIEYKRYAIFQHLMDCGADPNRKGSNGRHPLHMAARGDYAAAITLLLDKGADINVLRDDRTALFTAVRKKAKGAIETLIARGINLDTKDRDGLTARDYSLRNGRTEMADFMDACIASRRVLEAAAEFAAQMRDIENMNNGTGRAVMIGKPLALKKHSMGAP